MQYIIQEIDSVSNLSTGFMMQADAIQDIELLLEYENFNLKYFNILMNGNNLLTISSKKDLEKIKDLNDL